jgi:hypothetical protein
VKQHEYDERLNKQYVGKFGGWLDEAKKKGKDQEAIAQLTGNFHLDPDKSDQAPLNSTTIGRIAKERPQKKSRGYSSLRVLSVLYTLDIISKSEIKEFIDTFEIPIADNDTWEEIVKRIDAGVKTIAEQRSNPQNSQPNPISAQSNQIYRYKLPLLIVSLISFLLVIAVLMYKNFLGHTGVNLPLDCTETFEETPPTFQPDQGFSQFQFVSEHPESSILSDAVRSIRINEDGLWVGYIPLTGTIDRVSRYYRQGDQNVWTHYCLEVELQPSQNVNSFAFVNDNVYIATDGAGIGEFDGTRWRFYTQNDGLPSNTVYDLFVDDNQTLWAATYEGIVRFVDGHWDIAYRATTDGLTSNQVLAFRVDQNNNLWFATLNHGISRFGSNDQWYSYFENDPNLREIRGVAFDAQGGAWFGTDRGGVHYFDGEFWINFNVAQGQLPSNRVRDVAVDKFGRIWVATNGGLVYTPDFGRTWMTHTTMIVLDIEFGCSTCLYNEDHMWLALDEAGLGHVRIPPLNPTVEIVSVPNLVQLHPGQQYIFQVEVRATSESLSPSNGDSLRSIAPNDTFLYGGYPIIPVVGEVASGQTYTFSNIDDPIIAPDTPGRYQLVWRVWQGRRFVSEPIIIEFEVVSS